MSVPSQFKRMVGLEGKSYREIETLILGMWLSGKPTLVAGFTCTEDHVVFHKMIGIVQFVGTPSEKQTAPHHGWNYVLNPTGAFIPEEPYYFDSRVPTQTFFIPVLGPIFVAEVDEDVLRSDYPREELQKVYDFVIPMFAAFEKQAPPHSH